MVDKATSFRMAAVKQRNTKPERIVRSVLHRMGFRYRLHARELPGCPDIVFRRRRKVIFVHGCFWHRHDCRRSTDPISRKDYWLRKFQRTIERDKISQELLRTQGWQSVVVWECEIGDSEMLKDKMKDFLESGEYSIIRK